MVFCGIFRSRTFVTLKWMTRFHTRELSLATPESARLAADRSLGGYFGATSLEDERMKTKALNLGRLGERVEHDIAISDES